jgi:hypothetical protein
LISGLNPLRINEFELPIIVVKIFVSG